MNKFLQKLLFIEKLEIKTKISKERAKTILKMEAAKTGDYRTYFSENDFCVAEKTHKSLVFGSIHNSFAPVAVGKFSEQDGMTVISVPIRLAIYDCMGESIATDVLLTDSLHEITVPTGALLVLKGEC